MRLALISRIFNTQITVIYFAVKHEYNFSKKPDIFAFKYQFLMINLHKWIISALSFTIDVQTSILPIIFVEKKNE